MKAMILAAAFAGLQFWSGTESVTVLQEEDLTQLTLEKLTEKLRKASKTERALIIKELERRGYAVVEEGGASDDEDPGKDAKETLRTEHFDLKGPDKETLKKKAKELDALAKRFVEIFDTAPKRGIIVFKKEEGGVKEKQSGPVTIQVFSKLIKMHDKGEYWTLPWPLLSEEDSAQDLPFNPERALTHEVMHILFVKYVAEKFPELKPKVTTAGFQVGTPLPDWIDEGLAVLAEPQDFRDHRAEELREALGGKNPVALNLIPLDRLLEMNHPIVEGKGEHINLYYGQSHALVDHLLREGGAKVFRAIVAGLAADRNFEELLGDEKVTRGKLPKSLKLLEADLLKRIETAK